ncbi:MAG: hypothetical protein JWO30_4456 [Fibrobacteres bacterium]|nr:hypothetical protein [Fibrobacterota bacterium]
MTEVVNAVSVDRARREFLKTCMGLAAVAGLSGCAPLLAKSRLAKLLVAEPSPDEYRPVLKALLETVLPFGHPQFPLSREAMFARFDALFSLEQEARLAPMRRGLMLFDETSLFPEALGAVRDEERRALQAYPANDPEMVERQLDQKNAQDKKLLDFFLKKQGIGAVRFTEMKPADRKEYLWLWSQSGFGLKRQFYRTAKAVIMVSAYSQPELWKSIGYQGPFPDRG